MNFPAIKFPAFGKAKPLAGLVIRAAEVELVWMEGKKVDGYVRVPIDGTSPDGLTQAVQKAVTDAKLTTKQLAVSLLSSDILSRFFTIPMLPKAEWETAAQFEARKYIPFKIDGLVWDCHVLPSTTRSASFSDAASSGRLEVIFSAMPRERLTELLTALKAAGVQPATIEPLSLSLARLMSSSPAIAEQEFACLLDVRQGRAHLVIARDGIPYLTRDVNLLSESSDSSAPETGASEDVQLQRMVSELRVSMDFFIREYPGAHIARVLVFGEEDVVQRWCQRLHEHIQFPIIAGNTLFADTDDVGVPASFAAAIGLLRERKSESASLNLLKRGISAPSEAPSSARFGALDIDLKGKLGELLRPQTIAAALIACAVPIALCVALGMQMVSVAQGRLAQSQQTTSSASAPISGMGKDALSTLQGKAKQQLGLLQQIIGGRTFVAAKLDALARALPDGVWITSVSFDNRLGAAGSDQVQMVVSGACSLGGESEQEFAAIQTFEDRFKHSPELLKGFVVAQLDQINAQTDGQRQYTYRTFRLNCRSEKQL